MDFMSQMLRLIEFVPALVKFIEGLFGERPGREKKHAAMTFLENALTLADAAAAREIANPEEFKDGISRIVDGVVKCMNASEWARASLDRTHGSDSRTPSVGA
jgi:hypothetical protein